MSKLGDNIKAKTSAWTFGGTTPKKFKILDQSNFASSYYFLTRIVKPYLFKIHKKKIRYNDAFNNLSTKFEAFGEFSPMKIVVLKK